MQFSLKCVAASMVAALLSLAGCGTAGGGALPDSAKLLGKTEQRVWQRAQARWDALVARKLDVAYGFISPTGRSTMSLNVYYGRVNPGLWRKVAVQNVACKDDVCDVTVGIDFVVDNLELSSVVTEKWILSEGDWWFVYRG